MCVCVCVCVCVYYVSVAVARGHCWWWCLRVVVGVRMFLVCGGSGDGCGSSGGGAGVYVCVYVYVCVNPNRHDRTELPLTSHPGIPWDTSTFRPPGCTELRHSSRSRTFSRSARRKTEPGTARRSEAGPTRADIRIAR